MAIVPTSEYRASEAFESKIYKYLSGSDVELEIPFDGQLSDLEVKLDFINEADGCVRLKGYTLDLSSFMIPHELINKLYSRTSCIISINNTSTNVKKIIKVLLHEEN